MVSQSDDVWRKTTDTKQANQRRELDHVGTKEDRARSSTLSTPTTTREKMADTFNLPTEETIKLFFFNAHGKWNPTYTLRIAKKNEQTGKLIFFKRFHLCENET